jgi:hypothetical protein
MSLPPIIESLAADTPTFRLHPAADQATHTAAVAVA